MADAFGGRSADGVWCQRESFQMLEIAVLQAVRQMAISSDPATALDALANLEAGLPTQTVRGEEQIARQHFSTPLALSWLAARMALIASDDIVLEPSAGTGMLAAWAAESSALHLNEIAETRAEILRLLFPSASVTQGDGAKVSQLGIQPSVILMNPPFARNRATTCADRSVRKLRPGRRPGDVRPFHGRAGDPL